MLRADDEQEQDGETDKASKGHCTDADDHGKSHPVGAGASASASAAVDPIRNNMTSLTHTGPSLLSHPSTTAASTASTTTPSSPLHSARRSVIFNSPTSTTSSPTLHSTTAKTFVPEENTTTCTETTRPVSTPKLPLSPPAARTMHRATDTDNLYKLVSTVSPSTKAIAQQRRQRLSSPKSAMSNDQSKTRRRIFPANQRSTSHIGDDEDEDDEDGLNVPNDNVARETLFLPTILPQRQQQDGTASPLRPPKSSLKKTTHSSLPHSSTDNNNNTISHNDTPKKSVSFSHVQIREYAITLGDNPCCSNGPPVSLGWDYSDAGIASVQVHPCPKRRTLPELLLSYAERRALLLRAGYTQFQLQQAMEEVQTVRQERGLTEFFMAAHRVDEVVRDVVDSVRNVLFLRG